MSEQVAICQDGSRCELCEERDGFCHHHDGDPETTGGRPEYQPTEKDQRYVHALAASGWSPEEIAPVVGVDSSTLRKHFWEELEEGEAKAVAQVASAFFQAATSGQNPKASFKWLERRDPEHWGEATEDTDSDSGDIIVDPSIDSGE